MVCNCSPDLVDRLYFYVVPLCSKVLLCLCQKNKIKIELHFRCILSICPGQSVCPTWKYLSMFKNNLRLFDIFKEYPRNITAMSIHPFRLSEVFSYFLVLSFGPGIALMKSNQIFLHQIIMMLSLVPRPALSKVSHCDFMRQWGDADLPFIDGLFQCLLLLQLVLQILLSWFYIAQI